MSTKTSSSSSIGVLGFLGLIFVTLKLCGVITWSWWWVTLPFWGGDCTGVSYRRHCRHHLSAALPV